MESRIIRSLIPVTEDEKLLVQKNFMVLNRAAIQFSPAVVTILKTISEFLKEYGQIPLFDTVKQMLFEQSKLDALAYIDLFSGEKIATGSDFIYLLEKMKSDQLDEEFDKTLTEARAILRNGLQIDKNRVFGREQAIDHLMNKSRKISYSKSHEQLSGDIRLESEQMINEYNLKEADPSRTVGILSGLDELDRVTRGFRRGELVLIGAFKSHGKSTMMVNMAYAASVKYGYNSVFISLEMTRDSVRNIFYTIHSFNPAFESIAAPISYPAVRNAELSQEEKDFYMNHVIPDFASNPDYGSIRIEAPYAGMSVEAMIATLEVLNREQPIDIVFLDYIGLLTPEKTKKYNDHLSTLNAMIRDLKVSALTFAGGRGVPIVSGFQMNRKGWEDAVKSNGVYTLTALQGANEAEASSDIIITNFVDEDLKSIRESVFGMLKNRDGEIFRPHHLYCDFEYRVMRDLGSQVRVEGGSLVDVPV